MLSGSPQGAGGKRDAGAVSFAPVFVEVRNAVILAENPTG